MHRRDSQPRRSVFFWPTRIVYAASVIAVAAPAWAEQGIELRPDQQELVIAQGEQADEDNPQAEQDQASAQPQMQPVSGPPDKLPEGQSVNVGSFGQIDLHVQDLSLGQVLQLLSIQSQRNIVASRNVSGTVSADLYGVDFYEALDAVLHPNGFGYREEGNFIYVYTREELAQIEQAERQVVSRIVRLNYLRAVDAAEFTRPLLSSAGTIAVTDASPQGMQPSMDDAGADSYANSDTLVIRDYPENVEEIEQIIAELDRRPRQVLVEATVLEARLQENNHFGVDFALFADVSSRAFTTPLGPVEQLVDGVAPTDGVAGAADLTAGLEGSSLKVGVIGGDVAAFVRALDQVTDTTVLATPKILALNRQRAELLVGRRVGYLSTTTTATSETQTVNFLDTGTQLTVRPFISDDGYVRMELKPQVSDAEPQERGGQVFPDETTQELTTNVIVRSGQTVVLGGLFKEDMQIRRRQVPGLGDLPVVGGLFAGQNDSIERSEVIFLIKPTVLRDESLFAMADDVDRAMELSRVGMRDNLLPWSREKLTSSHLRKAQDHWERGNRLRAQWNVNLALHLQPNLAEAMELKEQITGERFDSPHRGTMNEAVDAAIRQELGEDAADGPVSAPKPDDADAETAANAADTKSDDAQPEADDPRPQARREGEQAEDEASEDTWWFVPAGGEFGAWDLEPNEPAAEEVDPYAEVDGEPGDEPGRE